jgi:hypothetical protein
MNPPVPAGVVMGNAGVDGAGDTRGWFVGHFVTRGDPRHTDAVEVKWGTHRAGESRPALSPGGGSTSLSILVRGRFRLTFPDGDVLLVAPGDYALWLPSVPHGWRAEEDSVVVTVRWPSHPQPVAAGREGVVTDE